MSQDNSQDNSQNQVRQEQIKRLTRKFQEQLKKPLPFDPELTLDEMEKLAQQIGEQVKNEVQKDLLQSRGTGYAGRHIRCSCGQSARYIACYRKQLLTLNGPQVIRRAYYYCPECRQGFCPLDTQWTKQEQPSREKKARAKAVRPSQLHLSMDGVLIHVGKEWKEVKLASAYQTGAKGGLQRVGYCASLTCSREFGPRMRALAHNEGAHNCAKTAFIADGGTWIWQEVGKYFPRSVQIVDFYHVTEHLWVIARARFGETKAEQKRAASAWMSQQKERLLSNQTSAVILDVESWEAPTPTSQEVQRRELGYLREHSKRMRYQSLREQGYHIGSGVIEAGCKNVVQGRFKGAGMRWSSEGAQALLQVRTAGCSSQQTDFAGAARSAMLSS